MYEKSVTLGLHPDQFWRMSLDEVALFFKAKEAERKRQLLDIQLLADLVTQGVGRILSESDAGEKTVLDLFPELFAEERQKTHEADQERSLALQKAQMAALAARINRQRKEVGHE